MKKKCLSCGRSFILSGSGKPQKYCSECARRGTVRGRGLPASKSLKTKAAKSASGIDLGSFVLAQIKAQQTRAVSFTTPEDDRVRIFLRPQGSQRRERLLASQPQGPQKKREGALRFW
jgi:hypothetical protein